jgi:hypothetical protein
MNSGILPENFPLVPQGHHHHHQDYLAHPIALPLWWCGKEEKVQK